MSFTVGRSYQNNRGRYKVLDIQGDRLFIEYEDGQRSEVSLKRQKLILQNFRKAQKAQNKEKQKTQQQAAQQQAAPRQTVPFYKNRCWQCGRQVTSNKNEQCSTCGWLKCKCGACGCNRPKSTGSLDPFL